MGLRMHLRRLRRARHGRVVGEACKLAVNDVGDVGQCIAGSAMDMRHGAKA
ncbi:hypothetical protein D3C71_2112320 [compost metagenome]